MSLSVDGIWKAGVWAETVWADGVWQEGEAVQDPLDTLALTVSISRSQNMAVSIKDSIDMNVGISRSLNLRVEG